ncbi:MAG: citrate synthase [Ignavibacteriales bacterium]|nr:Citrate synthase 1 [Ignavibacteriaceae bacterium]MCK6612612.1 citrate synthase [Ignavibacteriaceae bacterium]QOJ29650.1 MAG: citrate synthase [Ignavibacteriales bacterium]
MDSAKLTLNGKDYTLPVLVGSEQEVAIDITQLRAQSGAITLDDGYGNTGSCKSAITFIDGDKGILRYRGYPIEELANKSSFIEVAYLLIYGELPGKEQLDQFKHELTHHSLLPEDMKKMFEGFTTTAHPMGVLSSMVASLSTFYPETDYKQEANLNIIRLISKIKTIAAFSYKKSLGQPYIYPRNDLSYTGDLLHMMFAVPSEKYEISPVIEDALDKLLILHADHEQNCSTSTVRMAGSSHANVYATISAGVAALWGPLHGGANQEVIEMLDHIAADNMDYKKYISLAKDKNSGFKLMGFGHRVYKNFDPRAQILKGASDRVLHELGINDPLLEVAKNLERVALEDSYFVERKLYPNVDFYSGIIYKALGIPTNMFTVMFAIGRLPGWLAHWKELRDNPALRIYRPRQVYTGHTNREYVPVEKR